MITNRHFLGEPGRLAFLLAIGLAFSLATPSWGQKQKKNKQDTSDNQLQLPPGPLQDELDHDIGEMLGAWQVGDVEAMHKYYEDDATFTSGTFETPVIGWQNYVTAYQRARLRFQGMQLIRKNTFIYLRTDFAWTTYQWELLASLDGQPYSARGQTTLLFAKNGDKWLIVHNHTSQVCETGAPTPAPAPTSTTPAPAKPGN
jgi:ketosteroid isomerase-like protein